MGGSLNRARPVARISPLRTINTRESPDQKDPELSSLGRPEVLETVYHMVASPGKELVDAATPVLYIHAGRQRSMYEKHRGHFGWAVRLYIATSTPKHTSSDIRSSLSHQMYGSSHSTLPSFLWLWDPMECSCHILGWLTMEYRLCKANESWHAPEDIQQAITSARV